MASVFKRGGKNNRGASYYVSWVDHTGKRCVKSARTTDKATAERIVAKLEADAALRRERVIDPIDEAIAKQSQMLIHSHLIDYESKLQTADRTEKHINSTLLFIRWIAMYAGFHVAADINADGVNRYAGKLRDEGRSSRTIGAHLSAIKAFTRWLTVHQKLPRDPLISVKKPNPKADRRQERSAISLDEWRRLEVAVLVAPIWPPLPGPGGRCSGPVAELDGQRPARGDGNNWNRRLGHPRVRGCAAPGAAFRARNGAKWCETLR